MTLGLQARSIVHVLNPGGDGVGGLETVVHALACGHACAGNAVNVVATSDGDAARRFLDRFAGTPVEVAMLADAGRAYWRERSAARSLFRRLRPDVVHTHGYRPDVLDAGVARREGIATVTTIHGFTASSARNRAYAFVQRLHLARFGAVVAVSTPLAAALAGFVPARRLHVIPNGYVRHGVPVPRSEARHSLNINNDDFIIGWVGRLSREKGADVALEAVARLARAVGRLPFRIVMLGDGQERVALERLARRLGVEPLVQWSGAQPRASTLMRAFDLLLLSSRAEGTPMVLLEAMAAGVPIIATRVGGVPAMLSSEEALLVGRDDPGALAAAILDVMADRDGARTRSIRAAHAVETRFGAERWLDQYLRLYAQLADGTRVPRPC